jgi:hypothetical protein
LINVVCVLQRFEQSFTTYTDDYVQKLQRGFQRNLTVPFEFVCLTNLNHIDGVKTIKLEYDTWWGHWAKIEMFRPGLFSGPVLYSDIDAMILKNADSLTENRTAHVMIEDHYPWIDNSTLMWFDSQDPVYGEIYADMVANEYEIKNRYEWQGRGKTHGDQAFISDHLKAKGRQILRWQQLLSDEHFIKFSGGRDEVNYAALHWQSSDPAIYAYCMGKPKFHDATDLDIVKQNWV